LGKFEAAVKVMLYERFESESQVARDFRAKLEETQIFYGIEHFPDSLAYEKISSITWRTTGGLRRCL